MLTKPCDATLHLTGKDEEEIDELYGNEIVIEHNGLWLWKDVAHLSMWTYELQSS